MKQYFVYILTNKNNLVDGFTRKYNIHKLVYYEIIEDVSEAILREKRMKRWKREWKDYLINKMNPNWDDLYDKLI